ncbi:kinase-like domain-containing protein [Pilobolus umbonatus]|nr:kinase-like domain-containing protein [Pilobolus umbonatus]
MSTKTEDILSSLINYTHDTLWKLYSYRPRLNKIHNKISHTSLHESTPHCSRTLDLSLLKGKQLSEAIQVIIKDLFPDWSDTLTQLKFERVSGALTNAVFIVSVGSKKMLLRIYGVGCDQILDRNKELDWLGRLSQLNIGPHLLGTFDNGRFEEYLESTTLTREDIRDPVTSKQIASRLQQLHSIVDTYPPYREPLEVWSTIDKWYRLLDTTPLLSQLQQKHSGDLSLFDVIHLRNEIELAKIITNRRKTPTVFAHNDAQYGNILRVKDTNELVVIDFEYAGYNPRGYDIANHFCEWMYNYHGDQPAYMNKQDYPTRKEQIRFLESYIEHAGSSISLDGLLEEVRLWKMVCHLFWGLWGIVQASQSEIEFDYLYYSSQRMKAFKDELKDYLTQ